jgi:hypothetical protein
MSETDSTTSSITEYIENLSITENYNNMLEPIANGGFELCMLRLFHLLFSENNVICHYRLHQYMDDNMWCNDVKDYFYEFPGVMIDRHFYTTPTGKNICEKWIELLSNKPFMTYNKNGYEVISDITNFYNFIYNTFPLLEETYNTINQIKLRSIYSMLNSSFDVVVGEYMKCLPASQVHKGIVQSIYIDNIMCYTWELSRLIELDDSGKETILYSESELRKI